MPKAIDIHLSHLRFPSNCVVCPSPASQAYELRKSLIRKHKSYTVKVNVPMCDLHFRWARFFGIAEKGIRTFGIIAAILAGVFIIVLLRVYGEGAGRVDLFAAGLLGLGTVLSFWTIVSLALVPFLAIPASGHAHRAVRLRRYWPEDQFVRLEFQDEQLADVVLNTYPMVPKKTVKLKPVTPRF